jgi:hypothetical protein
MTMLPEGTVYDRSSRVTADGMVPYVSEVAARSAPIRVNSMLRDCGSCIE